MATFLVEAYLPATSSLAEVERRAHEAADELCRGGTPVRFVRSIHVVEDETGFHVYQAASREDVLLATERAGLTAQRIVEAVEAPVTAPVEARAPAG